MTPKFHVYIDEAGDPGVKRKSSDQPEWSDWFVVAAVVIDADREPETVDWVREMHRVIGRKSGIALHYRNLSDESRHAVCQALAEKPVRIFVVASHKDSMRRHVSHKLGRATSQEFYNWCLRLLLERVTDWCANRCQKDGEAVRPARIVFSQRGGHDYNELNDYIAKLEGQAVTGNLKLRANHLSPGVVKQKFFEVVPHSNYAGLQLADIAASAFFNAANSVAPRHSLEPANALRKRLARKGQRRKPYSYGLMLLPFPHQGEIPVEDREIFRRGGYRI